MSMSAVTLTGNGNEGVALRCDRRPSIEWDGDGTAPWRVFVRVGNDIKKMAAISRLNKMKPRYPDSSAAILFGDIILSDWRWSQILALALI